MSTKKKLLIAFGSVVALVAVVVASIAGTVAYMTSASKVSNVFTVGNVAITLNESAVDIHGVPIADAERTDRNSYHLMPGKSYTKDPAITVAASTEPAYLFLVTRNQITAIEDTSDPTNKPTMAEQMYKNGWAIYKDTTAGSRVWIYCGKDGEGNSRVTGKYNEPGYTYTPMAVCGADVTVPANTDNVMKYSGTMIPIFTSFHITTDSTKSVNLSIYSGAEVTINAVGIQADSFGTFGTREAMEKAWAAVVNQYPYIQDGTN